MSREMSTEAITRTQTGTPAGSQTEPQWETPWETDPRQARAAAATTRSGAGRHRGPVAEHDEATAPRGRHRKQPSDS
ncbi:MULTISPECIES: hypothetical protein [Streptomyces]|uniref:hypothetical protein n=1 Tax=Streptomyces TaxID=1883 RepID=UPI001E411039|nr:MULTISPECIES: hypothetical protein [Streptomyces]UFQ15334.1 hypothetical protein J2N69_10165 [Streptomyces huasconensis]WCL84938.1 hypothetical protein PPN52_10175 [Streptomyces sp. JCM 35825]